MGDGNEFGERAMEPTVPMRRTSATPEREISPTVPAARKREFPPRTQPAVSATESAVPTAATASRYRLLAELGRGGMGIVERALDPAFRREVAIKRLLRADDTAARQGFIDEAQITGQLEHPNIVPVHELGIDASNRPWLAMKLVRGQTLRQQIADWHRTPAALSPETIDELLRIFDKIADAVGFAHDRGVIHRDLKPENVMLGSHGEVLVMDWGLAKPIAKPSQKPPAKPWEIERPVATDRRNERPDITAAGEIFGTPAYMAPEQAAGDTDTIGPAADIFGLGAILYHLLALEPPYTGTRALDVLTKARQRQLVPPISRAPRRNIPRELSAIAMKAMAKRPSERYPTVRDLQADVAAFRANRAVTALPPNLWQRAAKWTRRRPVAAMGISLTSIFAAVLALVVGTWLADRAESARQAEQAARETERAAREAAEAREKSARIEEEKFRAELIAHAQQGEIQALQHALGVQVTRARDAALEEWAQLCRQAMADGANFQIFMTELSDAQTERFLAAYDSLFAAHEKWGVPVTASDFYHRGILLGMGRQDFDAGMHALAEAIARDPEMPEAYMARALVRWTHDGLPAATADIDRAIELGPQLPHPWVMRATVRFAARDFVGAGADTERALGIDADYSPAWSMRANLAIAVGDWETAARCHDRAVAGNPTGAGVYINRGIFNIQRAGQTRHPECLDLALADFDLAAKIAPGMSMPVICRGMVLQTRGDWRGALREFERGCELNERSWMAWMQLGTTQAALGQRDAARQSFDRAERHVPEIFRPQVAQARRAALGE